MLIVPLGREHFPAWKAFLALLFFLSVGFECESVDAEMAKRIAPR